MTSELAPDLRLVIGRLSRRLRVATPQGLTPSQLSTIHQLAASGPMGLGQLARGEGVTPATMSRAVDLLIDLGMIARRADETDGRKQIIELTDSGRATAAHRNDESTKLLGAAIDRRTPADQAALRRAIPALEALVADLCAKP